METTASSDIIEIHETNRKLEVSLTRQMLVRMVIVDVLNIIDFIVIAPFTVYDLFIFPEPILISGDIFYILSLMMFLFAIKYKHGYCLGMGAVCQVAGFALKIGGYLYADNPKVKLVTSIMISVMILFVIVPCTTFYYWRKIDVHSWLNKFDEDLKIVDIAS